MRRHELGKDIGEVHFILLGRDRPSFAGRVPVWEEDGQRVEVVVVYAGNVWIRDDDVWEVA